MGEESPGALGNAVQLVQHFQMESERPSRLSLHLSLLGPLDIDQHKSKHREKTPAQRCDNRGKGNASDVDVRQITLTPAVSGITRVSRKQLRSASFSFSVRLTERGASRSCRWIPLRRVNENTAK